MSQRGKKLYDRIVAANRLFAKPDLPPKDRMTVAKLRMIDQMQMRTLPLAERILLPNPNATAGNSPSSLEPNETSPEAPSAAPTRKIEGADN